MSVPPHQPHTQAAEADMAPVTVPTPMELLAAGLRPLPCWHLTRYGTCMCKRGTECGTPGKHPRIEWKDLQHRTPMSEEIAGWTRTYPTANWGIVLGGSTGLVAVDFDGPGAEALLLARGIELPTSATIRSHRGAKVLLRHAGALQRRVALLKDAEGDQVDLLANGSIVVVPPSRHHAGGSYEWIIPLSEGIAEMPTALLALIHGAPQRNGDGAGDAPGDFVPPIDYAELLCGVPSGRRHVTSCQLAGHWAHRRLDLTEAEILLDRWCDACEAVDPTPVDRAKVRGTLRDIFAAEARKPAGAQDTLDLGEHLTDLGNAKRFVARHGQNLHYSHVWGKWLVWDGIRWVPDETGEVERRAKETVRALYAAAGELVDEKARAALAGHALKTEAARRLDAMIALAQSEPGIPVTPAQLDADPWTLTTMNYTINLKTGGGYTPRREDLITKLAPVACDPTATCPMWLAFLDRVLGGNAALIGFLQRLIGYSLTGVTTEQILALLYGLGANGKSTLIRTMLALLGDYGCQTPTETLLVKPQNGIPSDLARLRGARFVAAVEVEGRRRLAEVLVKQLTGGDVVTARHLYADWFDFVPTFKLFLAVNHKPVIKGTDLAIWRRIRLVPFTVTIPEAEQDKALPEKLRGELSGILRWAVDGCLAWQRDGLGMPEQVREATAQYRGEMDELGAFLEDCCLVDPGVSATAKDLFTAYCRWCDEGKREAESQIEFGRRLSERGFQPKRTGRARFWSGIGLRVESGGDR